MSTWELLDFLSFIASSLEKAISEAIYILLCTGSIFGEISVMSDYNFKCLAFSVPAQSLDTIDCLLSLSESSNFLGVVASNYFTDP